MAFSPVLAIFGMDSMYQRRDSEESDDEGGLGNVNRIVLRPPGHSGKAKKGHLCMDASFETGNLGRIDYINEYEYDLYIRPDSCNPRHRFWFNFTVDNVRADQRVIFNIINFSRESSLLSNGLTPLIKSTSRPQWERLPTNQVFYHRSAYHGSRYVLSIALNFDVEEDIYQLSLGYPYSYTKLECYLDILEERFPSIIGREVVGYSIQKRSIDLITITNRSNSSEDQKSPTTRKRTIFIISRCHPGESAASLVCQGLMDFLVSSHPMAVTMREFLVFKIIPMINPDGVFLGNDRCSLVGADLNRCWNDISEFCHPTLKAVLAVLKQLNENQDENLEFVLDLHAHSNLLGTFLYGNSYDDFLRFERHLLFGKIYAQTVEDFCMANCMYNKDSIKAGTARRFLSSAVKDHVNVYSFFVSMMGFQIPNCSDILLYDEDGYLRVGRNLARAMYEYYKTVSHIPADFIQSLQPPVARKKPKHEIISRQVQHDARKLHNRSDKDGDPENEVGQVRAHRLILEIDPSPKDAKSTRRLAPKPVECPHKDSSSLDSGSQTPASITQSSSSSQTGSKLGSVPSLAVIDFSSLTMNRKDLRHLPKKNVVSL